MEIMKGVGQQQVSQLLHNKFIVVLGDSIQRSVYKDLVLLLQREKYLSLTQLKSKGEMSFEQDCLVEGGCLNQMHNGTEYREVRQFQSAHHLVRFYFVTRIYSRYMQSILEDFRRGLKPDVLIVNSCVWDISRYYSNWIDDYNKNLHRFFDELGGILPGETLVIWNLTMPLGERIRGGFLVCEVEHRASHLRHDVIEANLLSGTLADTYGMDVLDLHFQFRLSLHHRTKDGVHWNALAHRRITSLLLQHIAHAWGVIMPYPLTTVEHCETSDQKQPFEKAPRPAAFSGACQDSASSHYYPPPAKYFSNMEECTPKENYKGYSERFDSDSLPLSFISFEDSHPSQQYHHRPARACRPPLPPVPLLPVHRQHGHIRQHGHVRQHGHIRNGSNYRPLHCNGTYKHHDQYVTRSRHARHHYAPYTHHRPSQHGRHGHYH